MVEFREGVIHGHIPGGRCEVVIPLFGGSQVDSRAEFCNAAEGSPSQGVSVSTPNQRSIRFSQKFEFEGKCRCHRPAFSYASGPRISGVECAEELSSPTFTSTSCAAAEPICLTDRSTPTPWPQPISVSIAP
jgi:hypothetical protein